MSFAKQVPPRTSFGFEMDEGPGGQVGAIKNGDISSIFLTKLS